MNIVRKNSLNTDIIMVRATHPKNIQMINQIYMKIIWCKVDGGIKQLLKMFMYEVRFPSSTRYQIIAQISVWLQPTLIPQWKEYQQS